MIATVDKAESDVVPEFGVPLVTLSVILNDDMFAETYGPMSEGVTGSEGGGGRLISVGVDISTGSAEIV